MRSFVAHTIEDITNEVCFLRVGYIECPLFCSFSECFIGDDLSGMFLHSVEKSTKLCVLSNTQLAHQSRSNQHHQRTALFDAIKLIEADKASEQVIRSTTSHAKNKWRNIPFHRGHSQRLSSICTRKFEP